MTILSSLVKINTERPPLVPSSMGGMSFLGGPAGKSATANLNAYDDSAWLFSVVNRITTSVAATEWKLYKMGTDRADRVEVPDHPLARLWKRPNPFYATPRFTETTGQHLELAGEMWWVLYRNAMGVPLEMWPIRPDRMFPVKSRQDYIAGYIYRMGNETIPLAVDDVIFVPIPSPTDAYRGQGPVQAIIADIMSERDAARYTANFFGNSAQPAGIIHLDEELDDEDFKRMVDRWRYQHQGVNNAHRVAILERGTWTDVKYSMNDMQMTELRHLNRDIILGAFGFPAPLLGIVDSVNRANAEAAEVMFARWVLKPRLIRIKGALNNQLVEIWGDDSVAFDFEDPVPEDRVQDLAVADRGYKGGMLTLNEGRALLGFDKIDGEGGDELKPAPVAPEPGDTDDLADDLADAADDPEKIRDLLDDWAASRLGAKLDGRPDDVNEAETSMGKAWRLRLASELDELMAHLRTTSDTPGRSIAPHGKFTVADLDGHDWNWWAKYGTAVKDELTEPFSAAILAAAPGTDPADVARMSAAWAENRGATLIRLSGDQNVMEATRRRVNTVVGQAINEGQSLATLADTLSEDIAFSPARSRRIARTETTFAHGQGSKQGAVLEGRDEKSWITQGDALVNGPICLTNQGEGWIKIDDVFQSGHDTIPGHVNCRCNVRYRTADPDAIDATEGLEEDVASAIDESRLIAEARCEAGHLLGKNVPEQTKLYCRKCKTETVFH